MKYYLERLYIIPRARSNISSNCPCGRSINYTLYRELGPQKQNYMEYRIQYKNFAIFYRAVLDFFIWKCFDIPDCVQNVFRVIISYLILIFLSPPFWTLNMIISRHFPAFICSREVRAWVHELEYKAGTLYIYNSWIRRRSMVFMVFCTMGWGKFENSLTYHMV